MNSLFDTSVLSRYILADAKQRFPVLVARVDESIRSSDLYISSVTAYELRRGVRKLHLLGRGQRKVVEIEKLLRSVYIIPVDDWSFRVWNLAADLWAAGQVRRPIVNFSEADLLIAATARAHERTLVTTDMALARNLADVAPDMLSELLAEVAPPAAPDRDRS